LRLRSKLTRSSSAGMFFFMLGSLPNTPAIVIVPLVQSN
jgi:hypothetical protein